MRNWPGGRGVMIDGVPDAVLDLLLGSRCAVCGRPGRVLCEGCRRELPTRAATCWPTPTPPGLARPTAAGAYDGALKLLVNAHKEQRRFALAATLGDLLGVAVLEHAGTPPARHRPGRAPRPVLLVPVPSRAAVVRRRGHDPLLRVALRAASCLRVLGLPATVARLLRTTRSPRTRPASAPPSAPATWPAAWPALRIGCGGCPLQQARVGRHRSWWSWTTCSRQARPSGRHNERSRRPGCR